jgi:gluconate 2-dehydrogenase gamma chain
MTIESDPSPSPQSPPQPHPAASRRTLIKVVAAGVGGAAIGVAAAAGMGRRPVPPRPSPLSNWRFFTHDEAQLVQAVCEQIIPADQDAGATDADVVNFIDKQLVGPYQRFQAAYRTGLVSLQAASRAKHAKSFAELSWDQQTELLKELESGKAPKEHWTGQSAASFFDMLVRHAMQGFYGSPRHGGNKNYVSYKMLGLEYPRVMGRNRSPGI